MIASLFMHLVVIGWGVWCGAMIYEHVAVIPVWTKQPPESLMMWRGEHRVRAERFWMGVHPLLLVLMGGALATSWSHEARREWLFYALGGYAVIIATTAVWDSRATASRIEMLFASPASILARRRWISAVHVSSAPGSTLASRLSTSFSASLPRSSSERANASSNTS